MKAITGVTLSDKALGSGGADVAEIYHGTAISRIKPSTSWMRRVSRVSLKGYKVPDNLTALWKRR